MINLENSKETSKATEKLLQYKQQGYLFHGSDKDNIKILEPKQSEDESGDEYSIDKAVFAGTDPSTACIMGIITSAINLHPNSCITCSVNRDKNDRKTLLTVPKKVKDDIQNSKGFVYVLPPETFDLENPDQWQTKSHEPVKHIDVIEVNFQDYIDLEGKVNWKEE